MSAAPGAWTAWTALVVPAPDPPPTVDWAAVHERAGTALPRDYRAHVDRFGPGCVNRLLWVLHPDGPGELGLFDQWAWAAEPASAQGLVPPPHPLGRLGGLLPCAVDEDAGTLYWHTAAPDPDDWTLVHRSEDGDGWLPIPLGLVEFLHRVFTGRFPGLGYAEAGFVGPSTTVERAPFA